MDEDEMHEKNKLNVIAHELENQIKLLREALGGRASDGGKSASKNVHYSDFDKSNSYHYIHGSGKTITKQEFFLQPPDSFEWVDEFGTMVTGQLLEVTDNLIRYLMKTDDGKFNITCVYKRKNEESNAAAHVRKLPAWRVIPIDVCRINNELMVSIEGDFAVFAFKYCFGIEVCTEQW